MLVDDIQLLAKHKQQWGYCESTATVQKHSFVLPFAKECWHCSVIPWKTPNSGYCSVAYTVSKAEFEIYYYQATRTVSNCYIAIGVQQWGITSELTFNSTTTITYSLPLATTLYINAFMYGGGFNKCVQLPQILSQTSTSAQIYITWATDSAGYYGSVTWLAIGKQQWGYCESTATVQKHSFVLPFAKECWHCSVIPWKTPNSGYCSVAYTVSKAEFEIYYYQATRTVSNCYIAIGVQQWGITSELTFNSTTTITYSLPLATTLYINAFMYGGGFNKCVQLPQILSQTSTSAQIYITWATDSAGYYGSVTWLAIGKQQWGVVTEEVTATLFPLAFAVTCTSVVMTAVSASGAGGWFAPINTQNITTTSFALRTRSNWVSGDTARYIAVGY